MVILRKWPQLMEDYSANAENDGIMKILISNQLQFFKGIIYHFYFHCQRLFMCYLVNQWRTIKCSDPVRRQLYHETLRPNNKHGGFFVVRKTTYLLSDYFKSKSPLTILARLWPWQLIVITSLFQSPPSLPILHVLRSVSLWRAVTVICLLSNESSWNRDIYRSLKLQRATLMSHQS